MFVLVENFHGTLNTFFVQNLFHTDAQGILFFRCHVYCHKQNQTLCGRLETSRDYVFEARIASNSPRLHIKLIYIPEFLRLKIFIYNRRTQIFSRFEDWTRKVFFP